MSETASRRHCSTWLHPRDAQWGWWSVSKEFGGGRGLHTQAWLSAAVHRRHVWSFFLEWAEFWPLYWNTDWVQGSQKIRGTLQQYFILISFFFSFFFMTSNGLLSQFETKPFLCFFSCWLGLKSWICPSCCHPQFLPPTPVPEKAVSGQSQKSSTAAACNLLPILSLLLLPSACLAVHPLPLSFSTRCFCLCLEFFLLFFPLSEGRNQKTN